MEIKELWKVATLKQIDDDPSEYVAKNIDYIVESLEEAVEESQRRLKTEVVVEVSISKVEMTEKWKELFERREVPLHGVHWT